MILIPESVVDLDFMPRIFLYNKAWSSKPSSCQLARANAKLDEKRRAQKIQVYGRFRYRWALTCFLLSFCLIGHSEEQWQIEEREIFLTATRENLPVVAIFLGGQWCPWSCRMREHLLKNPHFIARVGREAILWEIFLEKEFQDHAMRQKYGVLECPQILLLDPKGREFARLNHLSLQPSEYAEEVVASIENFQYICSALDQKGEGFDEERWKELYLKAKTLSVSCYQQVIFEIGLKKEKGCFFHLEQYARALQKHKLKHPQILKMKSRLLSRDPENKLGLRFHMAVLEFQKIASQLKLKSRCEKALKPLLQYIQLFGGKDPEYVWQAEMVIAEYLASKRAFAQALKHAEASYLAAPEAMKAQILKSISAMQEMQ
jgi:hypothetical protein